ncbi:MAG: dienelactone hydrolase family protein [Polyangia bacterium]
MKAVRSLFLLRRVALLVAAAALCALACAGPARAEVKTQEIEYKQGQTPLTGFIAWDDALGDKKTGKRPGVLVIHEWWGHNQHARNQAVRLAKAGYVGFALDMYGKGKLAQHPKDAMAFVAEATKDPAQLKARFDAALARLKAVPQVDPGKIAAIGYCFGGGVALDMARAGEDLAAVATFHGSLSSKMTAKKGAIKPRILVLTGADDPMIGAPQVEAFRKEMTDAGARFEIVSYPGVKHSFTNPDADKAGVPGLGYSATADTESWDALLKFLREVFPSAAK